MDKQDDTVTISEPGGPSITMTFDDVERITESMRRREDQLARLAKLADLADLPIFRPLALPGDLTAFSAMQLLHEGTYTSTRSCSTITMQHQQFAWVDAETGYPIVGKLVVRYAPGSLRLRPTALKLASLAFRSRKATAQDIASVLFQALREILIPEALDITVTPSVGKTDVCEVGKVSWKQGEGRVYDPLEELVRLTLTVEVPRAIAHIQERGGFDRSDVDIATKYIREIVSERKWESANGHQSQDLLDNLVRAVAIAAHSKGGCRLFGLEFDAGSEAPDPPKASAAQVDIEEWVASPGEARP